MITVSNLRKTYRVGFLRRPVEALRGVSFQVGQGEIFGFLGPNGAGKTTTIKIMLGLVPPDGGDVKIFGEPTQSLEWRRRTGYMPESPNFSELLTGLELVTWFGKLSGLGRAEAETSAKKTLARVGLEHAMGRRIRGYSKGMLQRAGIAQALVASPSLLILDEPMTGLDPIGRKEIRDLILSLKAEGRTVIYSTHILSDVEATCDRVVIVHKGATLRSGRLEDILGHALQKVSVAISGLTSDRVAALRQRFPDATDREGLFRVGLADKASAHLFVEEMKAAGGTLEAFEPIRDDLETVFMKTLAEAEGGSTP